MAVVNLKSAPITNRDATPQVKNNSNVEGGFVREVVATVETTAADSSASTYRFFQIPSNARMSILRLYSDDMGTTGLADFGLYQTTQNGGAVVDADFFGSAVDLNAAAINGTDITHESVVIDPAEVEQMIWQQLGLSSDPKIFYDVTATLTQATVSAGTITLKGTYVL
ncbi:hypothetical protein E6Q11_02585 [Candidatus Dojkabacteria bacterium]|uniref:Uncharacterized protein n=1 Tax=Candidatus Dojkabacteria bacterium TaxID=2099670 RepID=A0A5C7JAT2_9BACT|nr:MAG: hypothetical protein E6Q11_02585 [Candidatus Dojkabacteria bacterium]